MGRFAGTNTRVLGVSVDHVPALTAWAESLGGISFPLLSDFWPHGDVARRFGVFREVDGHSERAIFLLDAEGIVRYVDVHDIAELPDNDVLFAEIAKLEGPGAEPRDSEAPSEAPEGATEGEAVSGLLMYCRSWCPDCRRAREWLDEQGIAYVEIDVDRDDRAREIAAGLNEGRLHTPTFVVGGESCVDFRPDRLTELLNMM